VQVIVPLSACQSPHIVFHISILSVADTYHSCILSCLLLKAAFAKADKLEPQSLAIQIDNSEVSAVFTKIEVTESSDSTADAAMAADEAPPEASMAYREVQYHMRQPHLLYACCTCPQAAQQQLCKHQAAVLMQLYPGPEAWKVMVLMLGTRLGMPGGCCPEHKEPLLPLHNRLLPLALPALRNAEVTCHVTHAIAKGSDASATGCCTLPPPTHQAVHSLLQIDIVFCRLKVTLQRRSTLQHRRCCRSV
jgi:hypothetical protein